MVFKRRCRTTCPHLVAHGMAPAQQASGTEWMPPYLSIGMRDDYAAVRYIAGTALQTHPNYTDLSYDYTGTQAHWDTVSESVLTQWENSSRRPTSPATLMHPNPDWTRIETYLMMRDTRPVSVSE